MADLDRSELLAAYDAQLRGRVPGPLPDGVHVERDGPLLRYHDRHWRGFVDYRDLGGLAGAELDELIARQVRAFAEHAEPFEWKTRGHDEPADLAHRLGAAGLVPEEVETVVIARVADVAGEPRPPDGVSLREVSERRDLERIETMEYMIWRTQGTRLADRLTAERAVDPGALRIVIAEADDTVVCAGWLRFEPGTEFATLWGGGTLPAWRGRGIYRALVTERARLAELQGQRYLQVDASAASRPILERLGFVAVTTTTPYVWSPPPAGSPTS